MALHIGWGTSESQQLIADHTKRLLRTGVFAVYAAHYGSLEMTSSASAKQQIKYTNALRAELPLLSYIPDNEATVAPSAEGYELHIARVDPDSGIRLDRTAMTVAKLTKIATPPIWQLAERSTRPFSERQAALILSLGVELLSHGLEVR